MAELFAICDPRSAIVCDHMETSLKKKGTTCVIHARGKDGVVVGTLTSHQCGPSSIPARRKGIFSKHSGFPPSTNSTGIRPAWADVSSSLTSCSFARLTVKVFSVRMFVSYCRTLALVDLDWSIFNLTSITFLKQYDNMTIYLGGNSTSKEAISEFNTFLLKNLIYQTISTQCHQQRLDVVFNSECGVPKAFYFPHSEQLSETLT